MREAMMPKYTHGPAQLRIVALLFKWPHDPGETIGGFDSAEKYLDATADAWAAREARLAALEPICDEVIAWAKAQYSVRGEMVDGGVPEDEAFIAIVKRLAEARK